MFSSSVFQETWQHLCLQIKAIVKAMIFLWLYEHKLQKLLCALCQQNIVTMLLKFFSTSKCFETCIPQIHYAFCWSIYLQIDTSTLSPSSTLLFLHTFPTCLFRLVVFKIAFCTFQVCKISKNVDPTKRKEKKTKQTF